MKRVTASEARQNWFRLLDEVLEGEVVVIDRKGRRIEIRRGDGGLEFGEASLPDYASLLRVPQLDRADEWRWDWGGPESEVRLKGSGRRGSVR